MTATGEGGGGSPDPEPVVFLFFNSGVGEARAPAMWQPTLDLVLKVGFIEESLDSLGVCGSFHSMRGCIYLVMELSFSLVPGLIGSSGINHTLCVHKLQPRRPCSRSSSRCMTFFR